MSPRVEDDLDKRNDILWPIRLVENGHGVHQVLQILPFRSSARVGAYEEDAVKLCIHRRDHPLSAFPIRNTSRSSSSCPLVVLQPLQGYDYGILFQLLTTFSITNI